MRTIDREVAILDFTQQAFTGIFASRSNRIAGHVVLCRLVFARMKLGSYSNTPNHDEWNNISIQVANGTHSFIIISIVATNL